MVGFLSFCYEELNGYTFYFYLFVGELMGAFDNYVLYGSFLYRLRLLGEELKNGGDLISYCAILSFFS